VCVVQQRTGVAATIGWPAKVMTRFRAAAGLAGSILPMPTDVGPWGVTKTGGDSATTTCCCGCCSCGGPGAAVDGWDRCGGWDHAPRL
jgi:hypothetical protein